MSSQVRRDIVRMVHSAQSGHPGGSLGCTEYLVALYFKEMQHDPKFNMEGKGEDVFFLSNGHISPLFYSVLARSGYFPVSELSTFRLINSRLQGHPATHDHLPGVRVASGSLGQGISVANGMAFSKKMNKDNHTVFVLTGDGELQEGQNWEAIMFAAHHKLDNMIVAVDYNRQQIDGPTKDVMNLGDIKSKFAAFDWEVIEIENGNDMEAVLSGLKQAKEYLGKKKPICILLKTEMGAGVSFMEGTHEWHGIAPNDEQLDKALSELTETKGDY
ncbi:MAG TPA: transketolase [Edaphocola sp.]|nr:transketolase [Edaphocola sp.]